MKRGRPKKIGNCDNRRHTIVFTPSAEEKFRELVKIRGGQRWLHRKCSELIEEEYNKSQDQEVLLKEKAAEMNVAYAKAQKDRDEAIEELRKWRKNNG